MVTLSTAKTQPEPRGMQNKYRIIQGAESWHRSELIEQGEILISQLVKRAHSKGTVEPTSTEKAK